MWKLTTYWPKQVFSYHQLSKCWVSRIWDKIWSILNAVITAMSSCIITVSWLKGWPAHRCWQPSVMPVTITLSVGHTARGAAVLRNTNNDTCNSIIVTIGTRAAHGSDILISGQESKFHIYLLWLRHKPNCQLIGSQLTMGEKILTNNACVFLSA